MYCQWNILAPGFRCLQWLSCCHAQSIWALVYGQVIANAVTFARFVEHVFHEPSDVCNDELSGLVVALSGLDSDLVTVPLGFQLPSFSPSLLRGDGLLEGGLKMLTGQVSELLFHANFADCAAPCCLAESEP